MTRLFTHMIFDYYGTINRSVIKDVLKQFNKDGSGIILVDDPNVPRSSEGIEITTETQITKKLMLDIIHSLKLNQRMTNDLIEQVDAEFQEINQH